jgi:branched-chain amino acid aminotransferase
VAKYDDAIMLDQSGYVAEATGANIFTVENGHLVTPLPTACLLGITRATVLDLAKELHIEVTQTFVTPQDVYAADECFLTGTGVDGLIPVGEVDGRKIGTECPGPTTMKISDAYVELTKTKFLTPVYK